MDTCPAIQGRMEDLFLKGKWPVSEEKYTHLPFLASRDNMGDIAMQISPGNGHLKTVQAVHSPRLLESLGSTNVDAYRCTASDKIGSNTTTYTLDPTDNLGYGLVIAQADLVTSCMSGQEKIDETIMKLIDWADMRTATKSAIQSVALTGKWSADVPFGDDPGERNNSNQLVLNTFVSAGKINPQAQTDLENALNDSGYDGAYVFGGTAGRTWGQLIAHGCCTQDGIDLASVNREYGFAYGFDKRVASALGSQKELLILTLGAHQLIQYTAAMNDFKPGQTFVSALDQTWFQGVVQSPRTGVKYDLTIKYDCGKVYINITATTKVVGLPNNLYVVGDPMNGVNGSFQGLIVNPALS